MTPRPRQILARRQDESEPSWWNTIDTQQYLRWKPGLILDIADKSELIVYPHGHNDQMLLKEFPPRQQNRFQPSH